MEIQSLDISQISLILIILIGVLLFGIFRLFHFLIRFIKLERKHYISISNHMPLMELICWVIYLLWSIQYLFLRGQLLTLFPVVILLILLIFLSLFALKDLTAGILFKTNAQHQLHDQITVSDITGRIIAFKRRYLLIEDENGRVISIPYSRIVSNIVYKSFPTQHLLSHNFELKIKRSRNFDEFAFQLELRNYILTLPWSSQKKEPKITVGEETESYVNYHVTAYSIDQSYFKKTEVFIHEKYKSQIVS